MKKNITALWITPWYPHPESPQEGDFIERMALAVNSKCDVIVLAFHAWKERKWKLTKEYSHVEVWHFYYPHFRFFVLKSISLMVAGIWSYLKFIRIKVDVIHAHVAYPTGFIAILFSKLNKKPLFATEQWTGYYFGEDINIVSRCLLKLFFKSSVSVMPVSSHFMKQLIFKGYYANYCVIPNVVDLSIFHPASGALNAGRKFRLMYVGSLDTKRKQVDKVIESFAKVSNLIPDVELTIIGEGPDKMVIEKLIGERNIESRCKLIGPLSHSDVAEEMRKHHVLVLFSCAETFSCVLAEAMATGLPVISSRCGGISEFIQDDEGILVDPDNAKELEYAMVKMIKHYHCYKPGVRREIVERFSPSNVADAIVKQYISVLNAV